MFKVYVVTQYWYEDWDIIAVFDSNEKAETFVNEKVKLGWSQLFNITELELNNP